MAAFAVVAQIMTIEPRLLLFIHTYLLLLHANCNAEIATCMRMFKVAFTFKDKPSASTSATYLCFVVYLVLIG